MSIPLFSNPTNGVVWVKVFLNIRGQLNGLAVSRMQLLWKGGEHVTYFYRRDGKTGEKTSANETGRWNRRIQYQANTQVNRKRRSNPADIENIATCHRFWLNKYWKIDTNANRNESITYGPKRTKICNGLTLCY